MILLCNVTNNVDQHSIEIFKKSLNSYYQDFENLDKKDMAIAEKIINDIRKKAGFKCKDLFKYNFKQLICFIIH